MEWKGFIIIMGVAGSGKTTIGGLLAKRLGCAFFDGDDYHSPENVARMRAGIPLTDEDRAEWLAALANLIAQQLRRGQGGVLACSALRQAYRKSLQIAPGAVQFVYLQGSYAQILGRLRERRNHFMPPKMLQSQFDVLEEPEDALVIDITPPVEIIVDRIMALIGEPGASHPD